jgi:hypothetical protein
MKSALLLFCLFMTFSTVCSAGGDLPKDYKTQIFRSMGIGADDKLRLRLVEFYKPGAVRVQKSDGNPWETTGVLVKRMPVNSKGTPVLLVASAVYVWIEPAKISRVNADQVTWLEGAPQRDEPQK